MEERGLTSDMSSSWATLSCDGNSAAFSGPKQTHFWKKKLPMCVRVHLVSGGTLLISCMYVYTHLAAAQARPQCMHGMIRDDFAWPLVANLLQPPPFHETGELREEEGITALCLACRPLSLQSGGHAEVTI